ncbi:MAG: Kelch repeat-containing protein [Gemmatimonadales bacterium]
MLLSLLTLAQIWTAAPSLPAPTTNNAVAVWSDGTTTTVYSFLGLDSTKIWSGPTNRAFAWTVGEPSWREMEPVPGPGRLAGTAQTVGGLVYVFGGYTVAEDGSERSVPNVDVFDPGTGRWSNAAPMPVPVDDAVSGVWRDSLIYLVSGWHDTDNVSNVQIYDPASDTWQQATPIPGRPVFGHTGSLAGNTIVYVDGARRSDGPMRYRLEFSSWRGEIDPRNPTQISWRAITKHPGPALYRAAAVAAGNDVIFAGGTGNAYNYNGIGYDGVPSRPLDAVFAFDVASRAWRTLPSLTVPSMDHRGIAIADGRLVIVGGMVGEQVVTRQVVTANVDEVLGSGRQ